MDLTALGNDYRITCCGNTFAITPKRATPCPTCGCAYRVDADRDGQVVIAVIRTIPDVIDYERRTSGTS